MIKNEHFQKDKELGIRGPNNNNSSIIIISDQLQIVKIGLNGLSFVKLYFAFVL